MIRLDVFADPVCPWCYLGKAQLDRALEANPDHPFTLEWHPFQLNPGLPAEGVDRADYMLRLFGTQERAVQAHLRLEELGREAGVNFDFAAITRVPNTLDAHRLMHWAGLEGRQGAVISALFRAYWREGRDIGDRAVLADLAEAAGMDRAMVARLLDSDADSDTVLGRDAHARERGVNAVPTFIIADTYVVSGAQKPAFWADVIRDIAERGDE